MIAPADVDKYLPKSGLWTTRGVAHNVVDMRYSVSQRRTDLKTKCIHLKLEWSQRLRRATSSTKFSEGNTDRQVSSSVEVEKTKIERSEAEGRDFRAIAALMSQSGKNDKGSEQRSW